MGTQSAQWEKKELNLVTCSTSANMNFKVGKCQLKLCGGLWRFDKAQLQKMPPGGLWDLVF